MGQTHEKCAAVGRPTHPQQQTCGDKTCDAVKLLAGRRCLLSVRVEASVQRVAQGGIPAQDVPAQSKNGQGAARRLDGLPVAEIFRALYPDGVKLATYLLTDESRAQDIAQDVLIGLLAESNRAHVEDLRNYYLQSVRNRVKNDFRERVRRLTREHHYWQKHQPQNDTSLRSDCSIDVNKELKKLSPTEREVLVLTYWLGYSNEQISKFTGRPVGSIKSLKHRATSKLRERLDVYKQH